jgi:integrase
MKARYRLVTRGCRGGIFYYFDKQTKKRRSLHTTNEDEAREIVEAKNAAERQPVLNLQIAKAYLAGADSGFVKRTWREVMDEFVRVKQGTNRTRSERAMADKAFDLIRDLEVIETRGEHLLRTLEAGCISTNNYLRRLHNFALDMGWLPWPVLAKRRWPAIHYREKRGITKEEHELIVSRERNVELRSFYWCCWHIGGSQSDVAHLKAEEIDWPAMVVSFFRSKTGVAQIVHFGDGLAEVFKGLPASGPLFPRLFAMDEKHRASLFQRACRRVKVTGVSLHSYRYAWAERARKAGYPERFAQEALGHTSKAVHRAYAKKAKVELPPLEEFEKKIIPFRATVRNGEEASSTQPQPQQTTEAVNT